MGVLLLGAMAVGNVDCVEERAPIDRVQPMALNKHFFVGASLSNPSETIEFYSNNFVIDASVSNNLVPVGTYDDVDRVHWEIQENVLLVRKAYDYVTGADGRRATGRANNGLVVAAYRITDHFDIRNEYNPTTGEPANVVSENRVDRPWYARDFMRVDWSQNLVDNPDWAWLFYGSIFGDLSFQPVRYTVSDPASRFAPNLCEALIPAEELPEESRAVLGEAVTINVRGTNKTYYHALYNWKAQCPASLRVDASRARYIDVESDVGYFDVTSRWLVSPEMNHSFGFPLPTCFIYNLFTGSDSYDCNPQESTIRTSFRRVTNRDFQPLELTRQPYDLVGGPRATRNGFDMGYGATDNNFHRYQMIHNIWMESHTAQTCRARNPEDPGDPNECNMVPGSYCDTVVGRCTIPYKDRRIRPIVYYLNPETPPEFQDHMEREVNGVLQYRMPTDEERRTRPSNAGGWRFVTGATEQLVNTWDLAVRRAVASAREVECRKLGMSRDVCRNRFFDANPVPQEDGAFLGASPKATPQGATAIPRAVVACHNPVAPTDDPHCREVGYRVRLGDIRYNHITYVPGNSRAPFGGIAHWGYDPLTGEIVSNGATNMGRSVEYAATQQRDWIRLIINQLDPSAESLTVERYMNNEPGAVLAQYFRNPGATRLGNIDVGTPMSPEQLVERAASITLTGDAAQIAREMPNHGRDLAAGLQAYDRIARNQVPIHMDPTGQGMRTHVAASQAARRLQGTPLETELLDANTLRLMGQFGSNISQNALNAASPLRFMDPETLVNLRDELMRRAEARGFCFQDAGAPPMVGSEDLQGVARWFLQKYRTLTPEARNQRILQDLRIDAYKGIALHEIGHSIGLYHLPVSSYDSMNYNPQYWQLRTRNGQAARACQMCTTSGSNVTCTNTRNPDRNNDNCMGPRFYDPETDEEKGIRPLEAGNHHAGINYFGNTSTMEYQWDRFGETVGAGSYDFYAMGVLYGRVVEVMESDEARGGMPVEEQRRFSPRLDSQLSERDSVYWNDPAFGTASGDPTFGMPMHYTELARQMRIFDPARCRDATPAEQERYRWRLVDGKICAHAPRDYAFLRDMETSLRYYRGKPEPSDDPEDLTYAWRVKEGMPNAGQVRWRYRVAWDRGTGYPHINFFDQGADIYETTLSIVKKYELTYPVNYFRRGQREWASWGVSQAVASRLFRLIRGYHWNVARDIALYRGFYNDATFQALARSEGFLAPSVAAQPVMFNFFAGVLLRPGVGDFAPDDNRQFFFVNARTPEMIAANQRIFNTEVVRGIPEFRVGVVNGRYIDDDFDNYNGGSLDYNSYQRREGASLEKTFAAIMFMDSRPTFSSITRHLYLDGRDFLVNFYTDFPNETRRLLGGLLAEDWPTVAPYVPAPTSRGQEVTPQYLNFSAATLTRPAGTTHMLFPNFGYRQQLGLAIFGMLFSSLNSDTRVINLMRIWTPGGNEEVGVPENERIYFTNPMTGITYVARRYGIDPALTAIRGNVPTDGGVAARMLLHANELLKSTFQTDGTNPDGTPRVLRDMQGRPLPRNTTSAQDQARAETWFRYYVGLLDAMRLVSNVFGYGRP